MTYSFRVNSHSEVDYLRIIDENKDAWAFVVKAPTEPTFSRLYIAPQVVTKAIQTENTLTSLEKSGGVAVDYWLVAPSKDTKCGWKWRYIDQSESTYALDEIERIMTPPKHKVTITVLPAKRAEP